MHVRVRQDQDGSSSEGREYRGLEAEAGNRQVMMRVVVGMVDSEQGRPGLGEIGRAKAGGLGRLGFPERGGGVCQDGCCRGWGAGSTEESWGACSG